MFVEHARASGAECDKNAWLIGVTLSDVPKDHRVNVRFSEIDDKDEITVEPRS